MKKSLLQPPKWPLRFLRWIIRPEYLEEIEGDMEEVFQELLDQYSTRKARRKFAFEALKLFRLSLLKPFLPAYLTLPTAMIKHNLLITYRSFLRNKSSFLINLLGLSSSLACVLIIYLWVADELSVDKFNQRDRHLYQVMHNIEFPQNTWTWNVTPLKLAADLVNEMPEVEDAVAVNDFFHCQHKEGILSYQNRAVEVKGLIAGKNFFDVFSYKLLDGNKNQVLADKNNVVISDQLALKLFHSTENATGKLLTWDHTDFKGTFRISGIFETPPANATWQFDFLFSLPVLPENVRFSNVNDYRGSYVETFVILKKGVNPEQFSEKIADLMKIKEPSNEMNKLFLQQYSSRYLYGNYENGKPVPGRIIYVKLFSLIALFVLLIACVNFMNLSTARASLKMKEIGVKKTIGATRFSLVTRFLGESLLISTVSMIVALGLVSFLLPYFNQLTGKSLMLTPGPTELFAFAGIACMTGLLAGIYPAFYLSNFQPTAILKGKLQASFGELWLRKGLVVFQFVLSLIFIVGFYIVNRQVDYAQNKNLGYNRDHVLTFSWKGELYNEWNGLLEGKSNETFYTFLDQLRNVPGVVSASNMHRNMLVLKEMAKQSGVTWTGNETERDYMFESPVVGYDFIETLGIELKLGRAFSRDFNDDGTKIILNESAVTMMDLVDPVGKSIGLNQGSEIIGVVKDFHYGSLHNRVDPLIFRYDAHGPNILVKIKSGTEKTTIERITELHESFLPGYSFEFSFMDEEYQKLYEAETKVAILSKYFSGLAILISCLGLFGLAAFTAERRTKEIGIRKILGASVWNIVRLLSTDFTKMVVIAILIALPISYLIASNWLESFAYRIDLQWWYFAGAAVLTLFIAWATVSFQTLKTANINPAECLRDE